MYLRKFRWAIAWGLLLSFGACGDSGDDPEPAAMAQKAQKTQKARKRSKSSLPDEARETQAPTPAAGSGGSAPSMEPAEPPSTEAPSVPAIPPIAPSSPGTPATDPEPTSTPTMSSMAEVTYHKHIRGLLEDNCLSCHVAGGIGPFPLDTWESVHQVAGSVVGAVKSGIMPPWPAKAGCYPIRDTRSLTEEQLGLFTTWQAAGFPEGDAKDYVPPPAASAQADIGPATLELDAGMQYTPPNNADDYRCFLTNHTFEADTYLTALDIVPDQRAEVHHVQVHRLNPAQLAQLEALDRSSPESGYPCNAGLVASQNMFSWRPGSERVVFAKGDAAYLEAGSSIMLQVHYNTVFLPAEQPPTPDQSKVALWTLPTGTLPDRIVYRTGAFGPVNIPPGDSHVVSERHIPMAAVASVGPTREFVPGEIIGMTPHAHQLAAVMTAGITKADAAEQCLIDVPQWDFNWQLDYMFDEGVPYDASDRLRITCIYDNSAAHQPVVDGVQQQPRLVTFGEGSLDEMCLHYIWLRLDRAAFFGR